MSAWFVWPTLHRDLSRYEHINRLAGGHLLSVGNVLVKVIVDKHIPAKDREAVRAALRILTTDDFSVAARRIWQVAASEQEDTR